MLLIIGILIIPIIIFIIKKSNMIITRKNKILFNILLILISIVYIILCLLLRLEPFDFEEHYSWEYMLYNGDYLINTGVIFIFTPFLWIVTLHFIRMLLHMIRIRKNTKIKRNEQYLYYRNEIDKISPSTIMFASTFDVDIKKSIAATILKLKLAGYIKEDDGKYKCINKDESSLLESEKMVLKLIKSNSFNESEYKKVIEKEALNSKYIVNNGKKRIGRIFKILNSIVITVLIFVFWIWLDNYTFENYHIIPEDDGKAYVYLNKDDDIEKLDKKVKDKNDYYHRIMGDGSLDYSYSKIHVSKLQYGIVRKAVILNLLTTFSVILMIILILGVMYIAVTQIIYINKNYRRTLKGINLINKTYALKNYLKDYSLIKDKTEDELILWEYYLIYAVALDVNVKIKDQIIEKYIKNKGEK